MPELTKEALKNLQQTHAEGCALLEQFNYKPESFEIAEEVERHRWHWKPKKPKLLLVAESHVFTSEEELQLKVNPDKIKQFLLSGSKLPPVNFVRLVYSLAYGENDLLLAPGISNYGTPAYWDIFGRVTFRCPQPRAEDGAPFSDRMKWKVETLRELYRMDIWLLDASVHAIYLGNRRRLPAQVQNDDVQKKLHEQWWNGYGKFLVGQSDSPKIWVIGKIVHDCFVFNRF